MRQSEFAEHVRVRLHYDPHTGRFTWLRRPEETCRDQRWNARYAGAEAGCVNGKGYRVIFLGGKLHLAHRLAWLYIYGRWPEVQIDHLNHDKLDNRIENLRMASNAGNHRNRPRNRNNTSGVTGVRWVSREGKWRAEIMIDGRSRSLGHFNSIEAATAARTAAERKYGFHINHGDA